MFVEKAQALEEIEGIINGLTDQQSLETAVYDIRKVLEEIIHTQDNEVSKQVIYDWDQYFMSIACLAALRSKDRSTPVS